MTDIMKKFDLQSVDAGKGSPCFCVGPQNGEPLCPCAMKSVIIRDGRYVRIQDFGPVPKAPV